MVEIAWTISENAPFYDAAKLKYSIFADPQEVAEWFEEMYGAHDGFMVLSIRRD